MSTVETESTEYSSTTTSIAVSLQPALPGYLSILLALILLACVLIFLALVGIVYFLCSVCPHRRQPVIVPIDDIRPIDNTATIMRETEERTSVSSQNDDVSIFSANYDEFCRLQRIRAISVDESEGVSQGLANSEEVCNEDKEIAIQIDSTSSDILEFVDESSPFFPGFNSPAGSIVSFSSVSEDCGTCSIHGPSPPERDEVLMAAADMTGTTSQHNESGTGTPKTMEWDYYEDPEHTNRSPNDVDSLTETYTESYFLKKEYWV